MNKIDIIIPIYNQEKYLKRCLDSIMPQTDDNTRVILVNDGSTDKSYNICREYAENHDNITIVNKQNGGLSSARNAGLDVAKGDFVLFIDPDDYVSKEYISYVNKNANKNTLTVCSYVIKHKDFGESTISVPNGTFSVSESIIILEKNGLFNSVCNKFYSREIIENEPKLRFELNKEPGEDLLFNCVYFTRIKRVNLTDKTFYYYMRNGEDSLANKFRPDLWEKNKIFIKAIEKLHNEVNLNTSAGHETLSLSVLRYVHSAIPNMYRKKHKFPKNIRIKFYKEILNAQNINNYFKILNTDDKLLINLKKIYSKNSAGKMDRYYSFLMFIRNNFVGVYKFLRKLKNK
ncbi:MAG: glycosyltransferase family 2 protein [Clostridia bacterium]|nr:glycosyltransferase family 2 protein [Clostridia bacterium]